MLCLFLQSVEQACPECRASLIVDGGELVCSVCGCVVDQIVDSGPESAGYTPQEREENQRTGPPTSQRVHDGGLTTTIGYPRPGRSALDSDASLMLYNLRRMQARARIADSPERTLANGLREITTLAGKLAVPKTV